MAAPEMHRNVVATGMANLFNDLSSEMIYPLLPVFLAATLAGICALPASVLFGLLWNARGAPAAFGVRSAGLALLAAALLLLLRPAKYETIR